MQYDTVEKDGRKHKYWKLIGEDFDFCDSKDSPRGAQNEAAQGDDWQAQEEDIPF